MYNLIEHSSNYSEKTGSLRFYSKDKASNFNIDIANINNFKFFNYKANYYEIELLKMLQIKLMEF